MYRASTARASCAPNTIARAVAALAGMLLAAACATSPGADWGAPGARAGGPAPRVASSGAHQKIGRPYQIAGTWYVPARQDRYDETGVASWYGPNFHGKPTANGEVFDQNLVSAAHTTLPLPSIVEVRNLDNGRTLQVRVNDRGPFVGDRIIDLSRAAAQELGFERQGTARVRVRYVGPAENGDTPRRGGAQTLYANAPATPDRSFRETAPGLFSPGARRAPEPASTSGVYVQVASFRDRERAENLRRRLGAEGPVFVAEARVRGQTWHRVMIGPWRDIRGARGAQREVARMGFSDARIVERD